MVHVCNGHTCNVEWYEEYFTAGENPPSISLSGESGLPKTRCRMISYLTEKSLGGLISKLFTVVISRRENYGGEFNFLFFFFSCLYFLQLILN